jgi:aminoglycoside phosphotransferase (APT) family kinase protein
MTEGSLKHQLSSIDAACKKLQLGFAGDAKAARTLLCIRSLLVRLLLDGSLKAKLDHEARIRLGALTQEIAQARDEAPLLIFDDESAPWPVLHDAVLRLQAVATPAAEALIQRLLAIEMQNLRDFEDAFRAASTVDTASSAQAGQPYSMKSLGDYLSADVFSMPGLAVDSLDIISGGYSKLTLRARLRGCDEAPKNIILRVDRPENQKLVGTRVADEYPLLIALYERGVCVPQPYALESSGAVLGAPAIVLAEVAGRTVGDLFEFPAQSRDLGVQIAQQLARIHAMPESLIAGSMKPPSDDMVGMIRQEVEGFRAGWKALARPSGIIEAAFHCVDKNMHLSAGRRAFIHGDFGLHNILVDRGRITAVLDWEFARLGNPAVDLGWFYYAADHLVGWDRFLSDYAGAGGLVPPREQLNFYRLWGALRFAVLCAQVDAGFNAGLLSEIDYAIPGNLYLRTQLMRVAEALAVFQAG